MFGVKGNAPGRIGAAAGPGPLTATAAGGIVIPFRPGYDVPQLNATGSEWKKRMADGSVGQKEVEAGALPGAPIPSHPDPVLLRRVVDKSIAVTSGKGGVGKTITACNLAIYYARKGLNVGLVDIDPLSDVVSLLDLQAPEQALTGPDAGQAAAVDRSFIMPVFRGLAILFPFQKLGASEVSGVMQQIYTRYLAEIDSRFNLLLFDMPGRDEL